MINILKMDLYKMFHSKSFYILNIALVVVVLFMAVVMKVTLNMDFEAAKQSNLRFHMDENSVSTNDPSLTEEEYNEMLKDLRESMNVNEFITFQYSEFLISILLAIFIAIFICSESNTGFIKNIIPLKNSRVNLVVSKNIVVFIFVIIQVVIGVLSAMVSNLIVSGKINFLDFKELMIYLGLQMFLRMAFGSLLILLAYLFRSKASSMSIGILLSVNIHGIFLNMLDKVAHVFKIDLSRISLAENMAIPRFNSNDFKRVIIISLMYFIIYNIASIVRVSRMEIN